MARTEVSVQSITRAGLEATYSSAHADDNKFVNDGRSTFVHVKNGTGDVIITLQVAKTVDGNAVTDPTVTCTADEERLIGPFPADIYNQTDGMVYIDWDDESNVTFAVLKLGT